MTCAATTTCFRLLDARIGWETDRARTKGICGYVDPYGIRLRNRHELRYSAEVLSPYIPPPWLSAGCRPGEWYLCGRDDGINQRTQLLWLDPCYPAWFDLRQDLQESGLSQRPVAVDAGRRHLAVADEGFDDEPARIFVWSLPDGRMIGCADLDPGLRPLAVAFSSWCELIVSAAVHDGQQPAGRLLRFGLSCDLHGMIGVKESDQQSPITHRPIQRLCAGRDGALWACEGPTAGPFRLWRIMPSDRDLEPSKHPGSDAISPPGTQPPAGGSCSAEQHFCVDRIDELRFYRHPERELAARFRCTDLVKAHEDRFCLLVPSTTASVTRRCFDRNGRQTTVPMAKAELPPEPCEGLYVTHALDSFIPRCRWHRVRLEAEMPDDTIIQVQVATSENADNFPHDDDWDPAILNATDLLIRQPPGRYLFLRLRLMGTKRSTPVIHRVQIDFPRVTSLDELPAVYRDSPDAEDFTERFLSLFDATTEDVDQIIERLPALLDVAGVPDEVLPWLGSFLGIVFDPAWTSDQRRSLLLEAPRLYRQRGTVEGLARAVNVIFGVRPIVNEHVFTRAWGAVGKTRIGSVRLFGKSEARFRIGQSELGVAPLRSYGDPDHDPVRQQAHRLSILMPPCPHLDRLGIGQLEQLIANQKPAHTVHTLRIGAKEFALGKTSVVGIDTCLQPPEPPVLGGRGPGDQRGNVRLNQAGILRYGPRGPQCGLRFDRVMVGVNTLLE